MGAIGLALIGVSLATYLLAAANETGAWVALGVAAVITVAMPVIPVFYLRQLRGSPGRGSGARVVGDLRSRIDGNAPNHWSAPQTRSPGPRPGAFFVSDC